jgi:hypothetical protein
MFCKSRHHARAEAVFKNVPVALVGEERQGTMKYEADAQSDREKKVRLRTLRLAKEAIDLESSTKKS